MTDENLIRARLFIREAARVECEWPLHGKLPEVEVIRHALACARALNTLAGGPDLAAALRAIQAGTGDYPWLTRSQIQTLAGDALVSLPVMPRARWDGKEEGK